MNNVEKISYTPGPWKAGRPDMATIVEGYDSKWIYAGDKYIAVASGQDVEHWEQVMANARLIAAAPSLFEMLEGFLELVPDDGSWWCPYCGSTACTYDDRCERCGTPIGDCQPDKSFVERVRAIVSEVKGEPK